tara:strand:+ start:664 stop:1254 length:591 start_codon:yes stop_codon:yes gene_type:complete
MIVENFTNYYYNKKSFTVHKIPSGCEITKQINKSGRQTFKMKGDDGYWKTMSMSKIRSLSKDVITIPQCAKELPYSDGKVFVSPLGDVYSFTTINPRGIKLKHGVSEAKYPSVSIFLCGRYRTKGVHQLVAMTFIDKDYLEKGLVCMHKDDNKNNCHLSNLSVGTYSKNNKDAYITGVNTGNMNWNISRKLLKLSQ